MSDLPGMGLQMPRGRARSGAMHSELDEEMNDDLERLQATLEGKEPPPPRKNSVSGLGQPELSRKTVRVLTDLKVATAVPEELGGEGPRKKHVESEEEAEERAMAEQERKRRAAAEAAVSSVSASTLSGGGGGGAHHHASSGAAAGHAASSSSASGVASASGAAGSSSGGPGGSASGGTSGSAASSSSSGSSAAGGGGSSAGSGGHQHSSALAGIKTRKPADDKDYDVLVKLLLLGDGGVGKTSLMLRFSEDKFSSSLLSTAGVDYKTQHLEVDGRKVKLQIWDTAGQTRFHTITQAYYKGAHGIVLVYDGSDASEGSFHNVNYWMDNIAKHANAAVTRVLLGNKCDVKGKKVDPARGRELAEEYKCKFWETSAKDGTNVKEAFYTIARDIVNKMTQGQGPAGAGAGGSGGAGAGAGDAAGGGDGKGGKGGKDCVIM